MKDKAVIEDMALAMGNTMGWNRDRSEFERTLIWQEGEGWFRARPDCIFHASDGPDVLYDLKTTELDATIDGWGRSKIWEYALPSAWDCRGYEILTGTEAVFVFIVQETKFPYAVRMFQFAPSRDAYRNDLADKAVRMWNRCMETGSWGAYTPEIVTVPTPGWIMNRSEGL